VRRAAADVQPYAGTRLTAMGARPHIAAVLEDAVTARVTGFLQSRGWQERIIAYTGYGTPGQARVFARVVLRRPEDHEEEASAETTATEEQLDEAQATGSQRGWRAFITSAVPDAPLHLKLGAAEMDVVTDRGGYIDAVITGHGLEPGWHEVQITARNGWSVTAEVRVTDPDVGLGIVSDIDDTVMVTHLPRLMIAAWNTFVRSEQAREVVPGMAAMLRSLQAEQPGTPVFYLSTGAWNTAPTLARFLKRHDFPAGPLLLTDWGPTNSGWFRSGRQHKRDQLERLVTEFPRLRWILVGDDGQHDPMIYGDFAQEHPDRTEVVAIRRLTTAQQVLSHGLPLATDELLGKRQGAVPMVKAPDGYTLHGVVQNARAALRRVRSSSA
jgi:phosphatidate phosphatase APP1